MPEVEQGMVEMAKLRAVDRFALSNAQAHGKRAAECFERAHDATDDEYRELCLADAFGYLRLASECAENILRHQINAREAQRNEQ